MILTIFSIISNSTLLLFLCTVLEIIAVVVMKQKADALTLAAPEQGNPPDLWFGIPDDTLQSWLDGIGEDGRQLYLAANTWDLAFYMWAYMLLSGALMYGQSHKANPSWTPLSLIFFFAMLCDFVETILLRKATNMFPSPLYPLSGKLMSLANMCKWSSFAVGIVPLIGLSVKNRMSSSNNSKPTESAKTK